jgi:hypothetical protein
MRMLYWPLLSPRSASRRLLGKARSSSPTRWRHLNWGVGLRKGQHEGLISFETFGRIQARLTSTAKAPARKDISADFPLRGFILCNDCGKPLTA